MVTRSPPCFVSNYIIRISIFHSGNARQYTSYRHRLQLSGDQRDQRRPMPPGAAQTGCFDPSEAAKVRNCPFVEPISLSAYVCYPELCHAIAAKHRQFEKALRVPRRARLRDEVFRVVSKLYEHGEYPSYSRVQATLNVDSLGDSRSIREFVQEAKQELNVRFPYSDSEAYLVDLPTFSQTRAGINRFAAEWQDYDLSHTAG